MALLHLEQGIVELFHHSDNQKHNQDTLKTHNVPRLYHTIWTAEVDNWPCYMTSGTWADL